MSALLGACSAGIERFSDPVFTGNTDNQRAILANGQPIDQPTFDDIVQGPTDVTRVERAELPPPVSSRNPISTGSIATRPRPVATPMVASAPARSGSYAVPVPSPSPVRDARNEATRGIQQASAPKTVRGWTTAGATQVSARTGDTVASVARRYGVPKFVLADVNGLPAEGRLQPGQRVMIPTYVHNAPNSRSTARAPTRLPAAGTAPQSTGSISSAMASISRGPVPSPRIKPTSLRAAAPVAAVATAERSLPVWTTATSAAPTPRVKPVAFTGAQGASPAARPAPTSSAQAVPQPPAIERRETAPVEPIAVSRDNTASAGERRFRWPARGRIISEFGTKPGGTRNEGINLALPEGADIKAAEQGTVIYSGNELKGYGNLVLIRHADGWVSAYAHNSELLVRRGDAVSRGQVIAKAGSTGSVTQPQLHFELRRGNKPVDPMRYLARL